MAHYKKSKGERIFTIFNYAFMLLIIVICVAPLWHVLMASISDPTQVGVTNGLILWPLGNLDVTAYKLILRYQKIWLGYRNTILYIIAQCAITGVLTVIGGYIFSRKRFYYRNAFMMLISFTMLFNGGMIPTYMVVRKLGMLDTPLALLIPGALSVFNIIMMRTSMQGISDSLEDAARIDGAGEFTVMFKVILPLCKATLAVILLFTAIAKWNDWYTALLYLPTAKEFYPLQMFLREILITSSDSMSNSASASEATALYKELIQYASIIVSTLPILCIYPFVQKYFVTGITIGAVKG